MEGRWGGCVPHPHQASGAFLGTEGIFSFQGEAGLGEQHGQETWKGLGWP